MKEECCRTIAERVESVKERIENAALKAGRKPSEITLVGVTKTQDADRVRQLIQAGVEEIGENRVQELLLKQPLLTDLRHKTHLIGHLQRNKAKYLPGNVSMVQSVDSIKIAEALERAFEQSEQKLDVLIEVNIGDESSKNGVSIEDLPELSERIIASKQLELRGIMAIPPFGLGEGIRKYFQQMYNLFVDIKAKKMDNNVNILSMGMSADFEYAILEGSTMVRVGTDLFGPRV